MTRPTVRIHNLETNEVVNRDMNDDEFAAYEAQKQSDHQNDELKLKTEEAKGIALAKLTALGLTSDDLKALGL